MNARADAEPVPSAKAARWGHPFGRFLARVVWNTEVVGAQNVPRSGPVVLALNHTGLIDGPIALGATPRPSHFLVKQELFTGLLGWFLRRAGQISVDRDGGRGALAAGLGVLRRGGVVGIFPEGNRGRGDASSSRAGAAWLALNGHAVVIPVALLGTRLTGESVGHVPGPRRHFVVEFGEPVQIKRAPGTSGREALVLANERIRVALVEVIVRASARSGILLPADDEPLEAEGTGAVDGV